MNISVDLERDRQQQRTAERPRDVATKIRVPQTVERKRVVEPRDMSVDKTSVPERVPERPKLVERTTIGDLEPNAVVLPEKIVEIDGRSDTVRDGSLLERAAASERDRGLVRDDERTIERIRLPARDAIVDERDTEREESMRELVSSYKAALAELTFNSKPIITNLTIIAGENTHAAKGISSTVFNHIMEVPREQKLPSLYLVDSIVKNIGGEYIKYFAARLPEVFCLAYRQVDPTTNPAMQHLFRTWRGVFPPAPLRLIENELQISCSAPIAPSGATPPARPVESSVSRSGQDSLMPRTGHGIHVNPKYLEAQRQRLQQTSQADTTALEANGSPLVRETEGSLVKETSKEWSETHKRDFRPPISARRKRDEFSDAGLRRDSSFDFEYDDYGPNNVRKSAPGRMVDRDEGWEPGYFRDGDGEAFGLEEGKSPSAQYGSRNGYNWRQPPSRSTDVDGYCYNRGPGPGRGGFFRPVQNPRIDGTERGSADNWLKTEEEEYVWEDMSPRLRPPQRREDERTTDGLSKDDWYPSEPIRGMAVGETGLILKRTSLDADFVDSTGQRRDGQGVTLDQNRQAQKEYEVRRSMQGNVGCDSVVAGLDQSSGAAQTPLLGGRPHSGWPSSGNNARGLSPPARTRPGLLQQSPTNNNISSTVRSSSNMHPRARTPPTPTNGVGPQPNSGHFESQQNSRTNSGNFGGGSPSFNSGLSPVTPASGLSFTQRQHCHHRLPSPTQVLSHQSPHQQMPSLASSQHQNQVSHLQLHHEHHLARHQMQVSSQQQSVQPQPPADQAQSLQQRPVAKLVSPLLKGVQHLLQQPLQHPSSQLGGQRTSQLTGLHQSQPLPGLHQTQQAAAHQPPAQIQQQVQQLSAPLLPLISSQLAQSLQQLAQQQQAQQAQPSQAVAPQKQPQTSQALGILTQTVAQGANGPSARLGQASESQSANSNFLAAFLQSGLIPLSRSAQNLPQSQSMSSRVTASLQSNTTFQGQPPLPNGPPPGQVLNSGPAGVPGQMTATVATSINQMTTFSVQPSRYPQPPLPPGPPPVSTIVEFGATTAPAIPSGVLSSSISSLLSSLVAHGVIAPVQKASISAASPPISAVAAQPNAKPGFTQRVVLHSTSIGLPSRTNMSGPVSTVVVSSVSSAELSPHDSLRTAPKPQDEALGVEFKQELLRERHEYVLEALYSDFPRQCKTCGLRFKAQDEHSKHMDWHVSRNRRQKPPKKISRKWFVSVKEWLSGTSAAASEFAPSFFAEEPGVQDEDHELVAVPADENQSACALCGELFEDFYSDETDEWMYKGAVYLNVSQGGTTEGLDVSALGPIVHMKCKTESAENVTVDFVEDEDEVQPELQAADSVRMEIDGMGEDSIMPLLSENFDLTEPQQEEHEDLGRRKRTRY